MTANPHNLIPSGLEPIDKLLGGLQSGKLYLTRGDALGKSLFAIKFVIEGLKRGEPAAMVIRYSPEDAVRRFALLGYDCLEDVYSGRLVILEYSNDIIEQIAGLQELIPVLRELEWLLGETHPQRLIFDPVTPLVTSAEAQRQMQITEFAAWAGSFGATVLMVANNTSPEVIQSFLPLVEESFRFSVVQTGNREDRLFTFEKSTSLPPYLVEVDPTRGVFFIETQDEPASVELPIAAPINTQPSAQAPRTAQPPVTAAKVDEVVTQQAANDLANRTTEPASEESSAQPANASEVETGGTTHLESVEIAPSRQPQVQPTPFDFDLLSESEIEDLLAAAQLNPKNLDFDTLYEASAAQEEKDQAVEITLQQKAEQKLDSLLELFDGEGAETSAAEPSLVTYSEDADSTTTVTPLDELPESEAEGGHQPQAVSEAMRRLLDRWEHTFTSQASVSAAADQPQTAALPEEVSSDATVAEVLAGDVAARTLENLLEAAPSDEEATELRLDVAAEAPQATEPQNAPHHRDPQTKDYKVLLIHSDQTERAQMAQALSDYCVEMVHDGVSALGKLLSFDPDLVILDLDLPVIDGFEILTHIRASLALPVIVTSADYVRVGDRLRASDLGADAYLSRPLSLRELKQKARQLIARYRGIEGWILNSQSERLPAERRKTPRTNHPIASEPVVPYDRFSAEVESKVRAALRNGQALSIVGCRLPMMTSEGSLLAQRLLELMRATVRDSDRISSNPRNDFVILLTDADAEGGRAFIRRLRERVRAAIHQEPSVWLRSFPEIREAQTEVSDEAGAFNRRASDKRAS